MEEQLQNVFKWLEEKYDEEEIMVTFFSDLSGNFHFVDDEASIFSFDNILDVTKEDVDDWDSEDSLDEWLSN